MVCFVIFWYLCGGVIFGLVDDGVIFSGCEWLVGVFLLVCGASFDSMLFYCLCLWMYVFIEAVCSPLHSFLALFLQSIHE